MFAMPLISAAPATPLGMRARAAAWSNAMIAMIGFAMTVPEC